MYHTLDTQKSMKPLFGHPLSKHWLRPWHVCRLRLVDYDYDDDDDDDDDKNHDDVVIIW